MVAAWNKNAANVSNDNTAAAAKHANNSRNLVLNEVIVQTRKLPQLYPTPCLSARTSQSLNLLATVCAMESDASGMSSAPAAAPSHDTLTLAQLYHPSHQLRHHGQKYTTSPPPPQENAFKVATAGMIDAPTAAPFHEILTLSKLYHPI